MGKKKTITRWLGCFTIGGAKGTHGSFQMLAEAPDVAAVVEAFEARLKALYRSSSLFHEGGDIFLEHVLDLSTDLSRPVLVNYVFGRPQREPELFCAVPEQSDVDMDIYGAAPPGADTYTPEPLVTFKPKKKTATRRPRAATARPS